MEDVKPYMGFLHSFLHCWSLRIKWDHPKPGDTGLDGWGRLSGFLFQYLYWVSRKAKKEIGGVISITHLGFSSVWG